MIDPSDEIRKHFQNAADNLWKMAQEKMKREQETLMYKDVIGDDDD